MYTLNSAVVVGLLFIAIVLATEIGFRWGRRSAETASEPSRQQINTIQSALLGVLALLLGFSFSQSLERFDRRSQAVVAEANALGTAQLRAQLIRAPQRQVAEQQLSAFLDKRLEAVTLSLVLEDERKAKLAEARKLLNAIWGTALQATAAEPNPATSGLFAQSINDLIDAFDSRNAIVERHVPEVILLVLFGTFALTAALVGYASGATGRRASFVNYILMLLIIMVVFIVIDLDRPRRGLIEVSQQSLFDLRQAP